MIVDTYDHKYLGVGNLMHGVRSVAQRRRKASALVQVLCALSFKHRADRLKNGADAPSSPEDTGKALLPVLASLDCLAACSF